MSPRYPNPGGYDGNASEPPVREPITMSD